MRLINGSKLLSASIIRSMRCVCSTMGEFESMLKRAGFIAHMTEFEIVVSGGSKDQLQRFRARCEYPQLSNSIDRLLSRHESKKLKLHTTDVNLVV